MAGNIPTYNLKAVIHETGLTAATLRAWERRYGLLKPQRSAGGHRLYTQADIEMLKWLQERQAEGLSISHAVELWRSQEEAAAQHAPVGTAFQMPEGEDASMMDGLRRHWINACLAFDEPAAELALSQAMAIATPEVVCKDLLQKGLAELGEGWYAGKVSVQQEHFASALTARRLHALLAAAPKPTRPGRVLAACPPGEAHDLALLMLTFILRWRGWDVVYLGANVPLARLDETLKSTSPRLMLSVAQTLPGVSALSELADFLNLQQVPVAYGGGIFGQIPELVERVPGYFLGYDLSAVPQVLERLLKNPPALPVPPPLSPEYITAMAGFQEKEGLIASKVQVALQDGSVNLRHLEEANLNLSRAILSALRLGDIRFLDHSVGWLNGLLENYGLSPELADQYYSAFRQAVQQLPKSGAQSLLNLGICQL